MRSIKHEFGECGMINEVFNNTNYLATFTGNVEIERLLIDRLSITEFIIEDYDIRLSDGSIPCYDWAPAIFKPETGLHKYNVRCIYEAALKNVNKKMIHTYHIPNNDNHACCMNLEGNYEEVVEFCQAICNLTGMKCNITGDEGVLISLNPQGIPVANLEYLLYDNNFEF